MKKSKFPDYIFPDFKEMRLSCFRFLFIYLNHIAGAFCDKLREQQGQKKSKCCHSKKLNRSSGKSTSMIS